MAAKWLDPHVMDNGLTELTLASAERIMVVDDYALGESYAALTGSHDLGASALGENQFVLSSNGNNRVATCASPPSVTATGNTSIQDLHIAILDDSNTRILAVFEETSDQAISTGNTINIPSLSVEIQQPT